MINCIVMACLVIVIILLVWYICKNSMQEYMTDEMTKTETLAQASENQDVNNTNSELLLPTISNSEKTLQETNLITSNNSSIMSENSYESMMIKQELQKLQEETKKLQEETKKLQDDKQIQNKLMEEEMKKLKMQEELEKIRIHEEILKMESDDDSFTDNDTMMEEMKNGHGLNSNFNSNFKSNQTLLNQSSEENKYKQLSNRIENFSESSSNKSCDTMTIYERVVTIETPRGTNKNVPITQKKIFTNCNSSNNNKNGCAKERNCYAAYDHLAGKQRDNNFCSQPKNEHLGEYLKDFRFNEKQKHYLSKKNEMPETHNMKQFLNFRNKTEQASHQNNLGMRVANMRLNEKDEMKGKTIKDIYNNLTNEVREYNKKIIGLPKQNQHNKNLQNSGFHSQNKIMNTEIMAADNWVHSVDKSMTGGEIGDNYYGYDPMGIDMQFVKSK